jgi:hypothetical protein
MDIQEDRNETYLEVATIQELSAWMDFAKKGRVLEIFEKEDNEDKPYV